ncbi:DUF1150 family protein [Algirhabdus cladophorae]|uniref:DUF1150 family protein n=1 Tax=Algirhabdus cladophorae TaxID=3377108 RepID=UPI003B848D2B
METAYNFEGQTDEDRTVYVKAVDVADLPLQVQEEAGELKQLFAVHNAQGEQLALVAGRAMAFDLARQNDYAPVTLQ